jgi:aminoglycoside phosphotransferase (APT) family kinase protein
MSQRPPSHRPLDAAIALAAVREQLPSLGCRRAEYLGSGWGTEAYRLDDDLVARFPRTADSASWVDFDQAVLGLVADSLGPALVVPAVVGRGRAGAHFPYDFLVCAFVPGVPAEEGPTRAAEQLAADLGQALTRIHAVSVDAAYAAGLRPVDWDESGYRGPPCFLHGDFRGGNILVDPGSGRLAGVIDWGNAALGDPALDFMTLVLWRGWAFTRRTLAAYGLPVDGGFLGRVEYHARLQSLQALTGAVRRRADPELPLGWLRNAFSLAPDARHSDDRLDSPAPQPSAAAPDA